MKNYLKLSCILIFWSLLTTFGGANEDTTTESLNALEYYKILVRSGFMRKSHNAKYIASIKRMDIDTSYAEHHKCTGAIISIGTILTTAECTYENNSPLEASQLTVVVGIEYGSMLEQKAQILNVREIHRHENFNLKRDEHNIAVLLLNETIVAKGDTIASSKIATKPLLNYEICMGVGYGVLFFKGKLLSQILEGALKIWPRTLCESYLKHNEKPQDLGYCAGDIRELDTEPCKTLASEPLFCHGVLYGVSVFSIGCDSVHGFASVYINILNYIDWLTPHAVLLSDRAAGFSNSKILMPGLVVCVLKLVFEYI